jgi:hypothetical protein
MCSNFICSRYNDWDYYRIMPNRAARANVTTLYMLSLLPCINTIIRVIHINIYMYCRFILFCNALMNGPFTVTAVLIITMLLYIFIMGMLLCSNKLEDINCKELKYHN